MEEAEQSRYVTQLKAEFDSCDTTATGFLDRDELTELCSKLQLDAHLPLLLDTLLGGRSYSRVNFEEFKEGFVSVLSRSLDFSTSEDDSSYLEPAAPEEVKPKFVKGTKRYGRRSRPDSTPEAALTCDSEDSPPCRTEASDSSPIGVRRAKLRRATSLESVEVSSSEGEDLLFVSRCGQVSPGRQQEEVELGVGGGRHVLTAVCDHLGLQHLHTEDVDVLLRKLDADLEGRVSIREFKKVLCGSAPMSCSTPIRSADLQRTQTVLEERSARSASSSLLSATVGQKVLSRLDDGSGSTSPDQVIGLWTEEGIRNSRDILQVSTLDFPLEERLSLTDLTLALDNELLVSGNGIHQAALISYKNEVQHLQEAADQACRERDKVKADLELADQRNLQLVREVDDRHASMEDQVGLSSPAIRKKLQPADKSALCSLDDVSGPAVSIQTELALEQLKQNHSQELQQLNIQLETQVNYYERSLDLMRQSMEVERKDISQAFKLEISELEEQKSEAEQQVKQLKEALDKLHAQIQHGGGWSSEQERRTQRERAELEQNFAREIGNLVQRLSAEKEQLEAELKLKTDQEVMLVRTQLEEVRSENGALQERLSVLQQEVQNLEEDVAKKRRRLEEMEREHQRSREEEERLHKENSKYREEVLDLSSRNLQLSNDNAELSARLRGDQESVRMLRERLATVSKEQEDEEVTVSSVVVFLTPELWVFTESGSSKRSVVRADAALTVVQAQHLRQLQELQERAGGGRIEQLQELQEQLVEEQRRSQQLEETVKLQLQQSSSQISLKQDQHEKAMAALQQRVQDLEVKLKGVRLVLQEKVQQLKEQMARSSKAGVLLKELYVENGQLMKALQVTEQRQKQAEKKSSLLEEKIGALNQLLREIVPASLAT
uniref:Ninein-like n=1 Tax=Stegastes partitus TaxID=144197 RepID=A0A3B4ZY35_9TELE